MSNLKITNEGVMLCCGKAACPTIARADDSLIGGFIIKDDFGGSVTLSLEEIKVLPLEYFQMLADIFNECVETGVWPNT